MSTDKKELWLIVSPTECKRVHYLVKPAPVLLTIQNKTTLRRWLKEYKQRYKAWEEAERTLSIHPDCNSGEWLCPACNEFISSLTVTWEEKHDLCGAEVTWGQFPLNSIWHGEEREGKIWLTDKI